MEARFCPKDFEMLLAEMAGEHRLRRILGPVSLTALGVGCIIGAGIFVMTGLAAADYGGPASSSRLPSPRSAARWPLVLRRVRRHGPGGRQCLCLRLYHAGRNLRLDHRLGPDPRILRWAPPRWPRPGPTTSTSSSSRSASFCPTLEIPSFLLNDPFTEVEGLSGRPWLNLPSVLIMVLVTAVLVRGIKRERRTNALLVMIKVSVVCFVVAIGIGLRASEQLDEHSG